MVRPIRLVFDAEASAELRAFLAALKAPDGYAIHRLVITLLDVLRRRQP